METWSDEIKWEFFKDVAVSALLYGHTAPTLKEKKLDGNCTKVLHAVPNKAWK